MVAGLPNLLVNLEFQIGLTCRRAPLIQGLPVFLGSEYTVSGDFLAGLAVHSHGRKYAGQKILRALAIRLHVFKLAELPLHVGTVRLR